MSRKLARVEIATDNGSVNIFEIDEFVDNDRVADTINAIELVFAPGYVSVRLAFDDGFVFERFPERTITQITEVYEEE